jgi:oligosaccharide repeat unit polymerase
MTAISGARSRCASPDPSLLWLRRGAWWMHPAWAAVLAVLPGLVIAWITPADTFRLWWRTPKYFTSADALIAGLLLGAFVAGTSVPSFVRRGAAAECPQMTVTAAQRNILLQAGRVFSGLTLAGYAAWGAIAVARGYGGQQLDAVLSLRPGALLADRHHFLAPVAGVTTLSTLGPLALVCLLLDRRITGRRHTAALVVLVGAALVRTVLNTERLALIEMVVPAVVLAAAVLPKDVRETRRPWFWAMLPLLAPLALTVIFAVFEYTRSWNDFYSQHSHLAYSEFIMRRLGGYYAVANNNSAIVLAHSAPLITLPFFTVQFVWNLPILSSLFGGHHTFGSGPADSWMTLLWRYGNPELNNEGGVLPSIADYGLPGALVWWGVVGLLLGICYRSLRAGELRGLVLYAVLYVGLIDLARIFYWGSGRAFIVIVGGIILALLLHRSRARQEQP